MFSLFGLAIGVGALLAGGAQAMMTTSPDGSSSSNLVQPYTGGAPVSKVFYPNDGSTVTVTSTGAVIKQSPGHTPYREGWINPSNIGNINAASDIKGQLASGNKNPFTNNQPKTSSQPSGSNQSQQSSQTNNSQNTQPTNTNTNTNMNTNTNTSTPSSSASANAMSNATVNLTGSTPAPTASSSQTNANVQTPATPTSSTSANTSASVAPVKSQSNSNSNFSGKSLPNTGPGDVLAISGLATILGTIGHFIFQRLRFRSLA